MVIHIMKDGKVLKDITGHVVKREDAPMIYNIVDRMNSERKREEKKDD